MQIRPQYNEMFLTFPAGRDEKKITVLVSDQGGGQPWALLAVA